MEGALLVFVPDVAFHRFVVKAGGDRCWGRIFFSLLCALPAPPAKLPLEVPIAILHETKPPFFDSLSNTTSYRANLSASIEPMLKIDKS